MHRLVASLVALCLTVAAAGQAVADPPPAPEWLIAPREPTASLRQPSYFEQHYARVERDLLKFHQGYTLERMRERDTLELYGPTPGTSAATATGVGIFSAVVVGAAHTPAPLRFAFDRSLHLGPAIFEGGGMGAGFGGHL